MSALKHATHHDLEQRVAELATRPVETARRLVAAEDALKAIELKAQWAIENHGITQERPEKWLTICDLVRNVAAPLRDLARQGLRR